MCARILLRQWADEDIGPFAEMNADPEVMRYFPRPLTAEESAAFMDRLRRAIDGQGWGWWAVEVDGALAGLTGLSRVKAVMPFAPAVEISWRFRREFWGKGVAFAAARDAEVFGFQTLRLPEIVTYTSVPNRASQRLMERLGFVRDPEGDFLHPELPNGHPLRPHVLYRKRW